MTKYGVSMDKLKSFCQQRGFIYPNSSIYGGFGSSFDYGPLGTLLKENIKQAWLKRFVKKSPNVFQLDTAILTPEIIWKKSGHLGCFTDPLVDCLKCNKRFRVGKCFLSFYIFEYL